MEHKSLQDASLIYFSLILNLNVQYLHWKALQGITTSGNILHM